MTIVDGLNIVLSDKKDCGTRLQTVSYRGFPGNTTESLEVLLELVLHAYY